MSEKICRLSFRDPDGFVCKYYNEIYRVVFNSYADDWKAVLDNGLLENPLICSHKTITKDLTEEIKCELLLEYGSEFVDRILLVLSIETIPFITYAWEWTPTQLKEAALCTLSLQKTLIPLGLELKDATFYNIQFVNGTPVFIDLLSIKRTKNPYPWFAYGQFLKEFLFPLLLIKYKKVTDLTFLASFSEGLNKHTISRLLPFRSVFNVFCLLNVYLLRVLEDTKREQIEKKNTASNTKQQAQLTNLTEYLIHFVSKINTFRNKESSWSEYYKKDVDLGYHTNKLSVIEAFLKTIGRVDKCIDLGANTGEYSIIFSRYAKYVIAVESDVECCEKINLKVSSDKIENLQVANVDLANPIGGVGWLNLERPSTLARLNGDLVCALALIHHFYFVNRKSFFDIALFFGEIAHKHLIVEFIESEDPKIALIDSLKETTSYSLTAFLSAMDKFFQFEESVVVSKSRKILKFRRL